MPITGSTHNAKAEEAVQRFEIFTGSGIDAIGATRRRLGLLRNVIVARCRSARLRGGIACRPVEVNST